MSELICEFKISENVDTILTDIEGTTTSISFVKVRIYHLKLH